MVLGHVMRDIDGNDVDLGGYEGKVLLIVNVASKCGYTKQYAPLQRLYEAYKDRGLEILGFPSNDFGAQEPGTEAEIKTFCSTTYDVDFPMFSKVKVKGAEKVALYEELTGATGGAEVRWNFTKFLVGRDGEVIRRFESRDEPMGEEIVRAVEAAL